jgi:hypothetical protein
MNKLFRNIFTVMVYKGFNGYYVHRKEAMILTYLRSITTKANILNIFDCPANLKSMPKYLLAP